MHSQQVGLMNRVGHLDQSVIDRTKQTLSLCLSFRRLELILQKIWERFSGVPRQTGSAPPTPISTQTQLYQSTSNIAHSVLLLPRFSLGEFDLRVLMDVALVTKVDNL